MLNELFLVQTFTILTLLFFVNTHNIITLWYLGGIYLILLGVWSLLDDGDIFIGFLWVIDLGVGLVFFIFILHYTTFVYQKSFIDKSSKELSLLTVLIPTILVFFYIFILPTSPSLTYGFQKTWFFLISWYDYYDLFYSFHISDLNLLKEIYFYNNSFEFFLINFLLFYSIISAILLTFLIKRIFNLLNYAQVLNQDYLNKVNSVFFIRTQNFLKQQSSSGGVRVWIKKKKNDF